jgi:hypothetical protein
MTARLFVTYADGNEAAFELKQGNNVIGKVGGAADLKLQSSSLSRRHAMIVVGNRAGSCTVEDLGSTNKSHLVDDAGEPQTLTPGNVYPLGEKTSLVFGDVQVVFEFICAHPQTASSSAPDTRGRVDIETIKSAATSRRGGTRTGASTTAR